MALKPVGFAAEPPPIPSLVLLAAIGVATGLATLLGGALALRLRGQAPLILGFSAGAVIGVALFDLTPEALQLGGRIASPATVLGIIGVGFCGYMILERALRAAAEGAGGHLRPASLTVHSLVDGLGIGFAFQVAPAIGVVVAVAVLAHDIADGVNTVTLSLSGGGGTQRAKAWLAADVAAPLVGIGLTRLVEQHGRGRPRWAWLSLCSPGCSSTSAPARAGALASLPGPALGVDQPRDPRRHGGDLAGGAPGGRVEPRRWRWQALWLVVSSSQVIVEAPGC